MAIWRVPTSKWIARWQKNLRTDGGQPGKWLIPSRRWSMAICYCARPGAEATMAALDKKRGRGLKSAQPEADQAAYVSIIVVEFGASNNTCTWRRGRRCCHVGQALVAIRKTAEGSQHSHADRPRWDDL
jgi:hypothetical protein